MYQGITRTEDMKIGMNEYIDWDNFSSRSQWHDRQSFYGKALHIPKKIILAFICLVCMVTPGTNWIIPIAYSKVKKGYTVRYE